MRNFLYKLSLLTIFATYLLLFYFAFLMFWPTNSFKILISPTTPKKTTYQKGELLIFRTGTCRYTNAEGTVERVIRNVDYPGIAFGIPPTPLVALTQACGEYDIAVQLPAGMPAGRYRVESTIRIKVNILRTETYKNNTTIFYVTDEK